MSYQTPVTIAATLTELAAHQYVLPDIQREFVWSEDQIAELFDYLDAVGEFDHLGAVATVTVGVDGGVPAAGRHAHDAVTDAMIDVETERELKITVDAFLSDPMAGSVSICKDQNTVRDGVGIVVKAVTGAPLGGELVDRIDEDSDVINSSVRPGVTWSELGARDFVGLSDHGRQRVMAMTAFVVRAGVLLVGFGVDQCRAEVDDQTVAGRTSAGRPGALACRGSSGGDAAEFDRADLVERSPHRCLRRNRPEHRTLRAHRKQIRQPRRAVGESEDHLRERAARIVTTLRNRRHHRAQPVGQPGKIGDLRKPRDPGVRHQSSAVAGHGSWWNESGSVAHRKPSRTGPIDVCVGTHIIPCRSAFREPSGSATKDPG